jgi:hypothetical protein
MECPSERLIVWAPFMVQAHVTTLFLAIQKLIVCPHLSPFDGQSAYIVARVAIFNSMVKAHVSGPCRPHILLAFRQPTL